MPPALLRKLSRGQSTAGGGQKQQKQQQQQPHDQQSPSPSSTSASASQQDHHPRHDGEDSSTARTDNNPRSHFRRNSNGSNGDNSSCDIGCLSPPVLVYHANARSIVFRDQLRRANSSSSRSGGHSRHASFAAEAVAGERPPSVADATDDTAASFVEDAKLPAVVATTTCGGAENDLDTLSPPISPETTDVGIIGGGSAVAAVGDGTIPFPSRDGESAETGGLAYRGRAPPSPTRGRSSTHSVSSVDSIPSVVKTDDPEHRHVDQLATAGACAEHVFQSVVLEDKGKELLLTSQVPTTQIAGYCERPEPLPRLELGPNDIFEPLLQQDLETTALNTAEQEVVDLLRNQKVCVKTIKNTDWTAFWQRFLFAHPPLHPKRASIHDDARPSSEFHLNSFVTSTSLLPPLGRKMRCYGSTSQFTTGAVFALPEFDTPDEEAAAAKATNTWSWPAGYSAKTEFNRDSRGRLINGREEALTPLSTLREYNVEYVEGSVHTINGRRVSGISQIPYNEIFLRVGGVGRIVNGKDVSTSEEASRSFETGVGLPVALFCRTATFGHLISLLRTRARMVHTIGEAHKHIPLLLINPDLGCRVLTDALLQQLWKVAAQQLTPFQNATIAHRTSIRSDDDSAFQQKLDELIDLDESLTEVLTPEELARVAGGYGATDESVAAILKQVRALDERANKERHGKDQSLGKIMPPSHKLQDVVNEGLSYAVRSGDYHTARQLLILYSLVASHPTDASNDSDSDFDNDGDGSEEKKESKETTGQEKAKSSDIKSPRRRKASFSKRSSSMSTTDNKLKLLDRAQSSGELMETTSGVISIPMTPPPPPLETARLRGATNSDGLLAVLGAAQVLKAMQDGSAKKRTEEAITAVSEWIDYGEQSLAFRISSWYDQRAAQGDLKIATENNSQFMAFVSNKAISNRKAFCQQLKDATSSTNFNSVAFLRAIHQMLSKMHSPCLRLELLQYVLGLDNRYSVAHISRSIELAATCLGISSAASDQETSS